MLYVPFTSFKNKKRTNSTRISIYLYLHIKTLAVYLYKQNENDIDKKNFLNVKHYLIANKHY